MFDRIAPVYDAMNRVMTVGLDRRWRLLAVRAVVQPGFRVLDACCGTGDLAVAAEGEGGIVTGLDFSGEMLERARRKSASVTWVQGDAMTLPFDDGSFDAVTVGFGVRNLDDLEAGIRELRRVLRPGGRLAILEITPASPVLHVVVRPRRATARPGVARWPGVHVLAGQRASFPRRRRAVGHARGGRLRRCCRAVARRNDRCLARRHGGGKPYRGDRGRRRPRKGGVHPLPRGRVGQGVNALDVVRAAPGLEEYVAAVEERLAETVGSHPGIVASVGADALASGGKRLRPVLAFLSAPAGSAPSVSAGVAVELVHMATLVHDDLIDGAHVRRGQASAWTQHGEEAARAGGDYLFARAFSELASAGDDAAVEILAEACLALARGEALQRSQRHDPDTTVEAYIERCGLKTGKLFEAACVLGGGHGEYGLLLGVAFQIADDILDCAGHSIETGKVPGTDLRDGTPTLPLLLAAREDPVVRAALAGGPLEGALVRVAASGALERAREIALDYACRARDSLNGEGRRDALEALAEAVVDRSF
jgi:geranylgeranyl pyrophosphate synthase/SAM-dependent methyltransferase